MNPGVGIPRRTDKALVPEQQRLVDALEPGLQWPIMTAVVRCRRCRNVLGAAMPPTAPCLDGIHLGEAHHKAFGRFGLVLVGLRYDPARAERNRTKLKSGYFRKGYKFTDLSRYIAFLEHTSAAALPLELPFACQEHGNRPAVRRSELLRGADALHRSTPHEHRPLTIYS